MLYTLSRDMLYTFALAEVLGDGVEGDGRSGAAGAVSGGGIAAGEAVEAAVRRVWHLTSDGMVVDQAL
jgi:hypothetical protein